MGFVPKGGGGWKRTQEKVLKYITKKSVIEKDLKEEENVVIFY